MWDVVKVGGKWLDELRAGQLAAYDAMREVAVWERELEDEIWELMRWLREEED